jgi:hypothetical protein
MAERARANRKIHFTTHVHPVAFRAHTEPWTVTIQLSRCCAPSYVSHFQRPYFYVVQFIAPALLCALARNASATATNPKPVSAVRITPARVTLKNNSEKHRLANHLST